MLVRMNVVSWTLVAALSDKAVSSDPPVIITTDMSYGMSHTTTSLLLSFSSSAAVWPIADLQAWNCHLKIFGGHALNVSTWRLHH